LENFENYVQHDVQFISSSDNKYKSPYLTYMHDDINVDVLCDENGNVKVDVYDYSICVYSIE